MPSEKLQVILELVTGQYKKEAREAANATEGISRSAGGVTSSLGRMIGPAAIGGAVIGLVHMAEKAGENADRLFDLAAQTGLTTDQLQEYEFVAKTAGANTEVFSDAVKAIIKNLDPVAGAVGAAGKAYETLGINAFDASGKLRDAGDITDEVFLKLAGMTNITERNALAQDIFGKKWEETISVLDLGVDAIQAAKDEAQELGAVISGDSLKGADEFREAFEKLKTTLSATFMQALGELAPTLTDIAEGFTGVLKDAKPLLDALGKISGAIGDMQTAGEEWSGSQNPLLAGFGEYISNIGIMTVLTGNYTDAAAAAGAVVEDRLNPALQKTWEKTQDAGDAARVTSDAYSFLGDSLAVVEDRTSTLGEEVESNLIPTMDGMTRGLVDAMLAAQATGAAFREDLAADFVAAALSIDKGADDIGISLDELEINLLDNIADQALFMDNLALLYEAGFTDLAEFLQGEGADKVAGATASLVTDFERAASLENAIDQAGSDAARFADRIATALEDGSLSIFEAARNIGINLADQVEAGFSTIELTQILGEALGAPGTIITGGSSGGTTTTNTGTDTSGTGPRALGGPVSAFKPYLVGERGPELFVAGTSGNIIPNDVLKSLSRPNGPTIVMQGPTQNFQQDLQYATIMASLTNLVEAL